MSKTEKKNRIPMATDYCTVLGKAVYAFAYYEWVIIYIIEDFRPGFVSEYCREKKLTSKKVFDQLKCVVSNNQSHDLVGKLYQCEKDFEKLIERRNALIHAHPVTSPNGEQILNYQSLITKDLHDLLWNKEEVLSFLSDVDDAACQAASIYDILRKHVNGDVKQ